MNRRMCVDDFMNQWADYSENGLVLILQDLFSDGLFFFLKFLDIRPFQHTYITQDGTHMYKWMK